ncbi:MAG TPA: RHS repeat-associated core domain-containing protein, partial [Verrucomicrobiae bacterium]|nr:RHS repeat-associated core domain-containing protein [Verrucomicrobiae bacterium]
ASANGPWTDDTLRYSYDWRGRLAKSEIVADDGVTVTRSEELTLDALGRTSQLANDLGTFTGTYNSGNLTNLPDQVDLPGGFNTLYIRYAANAGPNALGLQTIHHRQGTSTVQKHDYTYELTGNLKTWDRTNASANVTSWALRHDQADQLNDLDESLDGVPQKKEAWHYDAAGNISSAVNLPAGGPGTLQIHTNEGRNQLATLGGPGKASVEGTTDEASQVKVNGSAATVTKLGPSGPWQFKKEVSLVTGSNAISVEATDANSNVKTNNYTVTVSAGVDQEVDYDANGNVTEQRDGSGTVIQRLEWDAQNQLLAVQSAAVPVTGARRSEFGYDGFGRRVRQVEKEHNGTIWVVLSQWSYIWDGLELAQKRDSVSNVVAATYYAGGEKAGANALVYLGDHLGSVRRWYRVSDGVIGEAEFGAYGELSLTSAGPGVTERGFTGHLTHAPSGLTLAPYRIYSPQLKRWLSEDPIEESGGLNLYGYVGNSPVNAWDPLGLEDYSFHKEGSKGDYLHKKAGGTMPKEFSVAAHINEFDKNQIIEERGKKKSGVTPSQLKDILNDPKSGYVKDTPIRLNVCNTGEGGDDSYAQKLADLMGVDVTAPTGTLTVAQEGITVRNPFNEDKPLYEPPVTFTPEPGTSYKTFSPQKR